MDGSVRYYPLYKQAVVDLMEEDPLPGHVITDRWLDDHLGLERPGPDGRAADERQYRLDRFGAVERFKDWLLEKHKLALRRVDRGYMVVPPGEQAQFAEEEGGALIERGLRKQRKLLHNTRLEALSKGERQRHEESLARLSAREAFMRHGKQLSAPRRRPLAQIEK